MTFTTEFLMSPELSEDAPEPAPPVRDEDLGIDPQVLFSRIAKHARQEQMPGEAKARVLKAIEQERQRQNAERLA